MFADIPCGICRFDGDRYLISHGGDFYAFCEFGGPFSAPIAKNHISPVLILHPDASFRFYVVFRKSGGMAVFYDSAGEGRERFLRRTAAASS